MNVLIRKVLFSPPTADIDFNYGFLVWSRAEQDALRHLKPKCRRGQAVA